MTKRFFVNWSIWIGCCAGLYVYLYLLTPLAPYGKVAATFVAVPLYLCMGAKKEEFVDYALSAAGGVLWAVFYIYCITKMIEAGYSAALSNGLMVGVITIVLCAIHFILPTPFSTRVPMMFGAIAVTFLTGGADWPVTLTTLVLGVCLGFLCNVGTWFLDEEGRWCLPKKD